MTKKEQKEKAAGFYKDMYRNRRFEEEVFEFYKRGEMPGLAHLSLGQEAVAAGVCGAMEERDFLTVTHRGHGKLLARGADMNRMMAEILGKSTGYSKGKGGSIHIMAMDKGILGANGIVGGGVPIATGSAYASLYKGTDEVTVCVFGDGASNEGVVHESINMAAAWNLPVVYVVVNNLYGISVDIRRVTKEHQISKRAVGYGIDGITVDGNDVFLVYETCKKAIDKARSGEGPSIVELLTYRWQGHHVGDPGVYRPKEEVAEWREKDPIKNLEEKDLLTMKEIEDIREEVDAEVREACKFAVESPYADVSEAYTDLFTE